MNDDLMFEYLLQMGAMRPEEIEMMRKQKQVEALRGGAMETPQGQMVGRTYVAPSITQYAAQLGKGYMAGQGQKQVDTQMGDLTARQKAMLEELKRKRTAAVPMGPSAMYSGSLLPTGDGPAY